MVGKRVYFKTAAHVVTVEFTGTAINAATNLTLAAMTPKGGLIDAIETPFKFIFKEPKKSNMDKSVTWKNVAGNLTAGGVLVFSMIVDLVNGSLSRKDIYFNFYRSEPNDSRKVVISVHSTDVQQMYDAYAGQVIGGYEARYCYVASLAMWTNACEDLYEELSGDTADHSYIYDLIVSVDARHKGSSAFANLWINAENEIMATPILYDDDYVQLVKRPSILTLFRDYTVLINLPLSDTVNLDQSYIDLFNKVYEGA